MNYKIKRIINYCIIINIKKLITFYYFYNYLNMNTNK